MISFSVPFSVSPIISVLKLLDLSSVSYILIHDFRGGGVTNLVTYVLFILDY